MLVEAGASLLAKDENNKQPHEVAKNRRTLICFPRVIDPAEMQVAEVGAMAKDVIDYGDQPLPSLLSFPINKSIPRV